MKYISINRILADKISGEWGIEPEGDCGVKIIRTANFTNLGIIDFSNIVFRKIDPKKIEKKKLITGDVIIEKSGGSPSQPVGRVVYFENSDNSIYLCNNFTTVLRSDKSYVFPKYLFYVLFYNHLTKKTLQFQNRTTGIINLKLENYLKSEIPLPHLDDQIRIANILTRAETLIAKRKESIKILDEFLKSTFLEMFGDPVRNEKGWATIPMHKVGDFISGGTPSKERNDFWNGTFPWIIPKDMKVPYISNSQDYISNKVFEETSLKKIATGHLLIVVRGMILAHSFPTAINTIQVSINQDMKAILPNGKILVHYLKNCLDNMKRQILAIITTAGHGTKKLDTDSMKKVLIPVPPLSLQNQFAIIVKKVESLKARYSLSLTNLENLYGSLSQRAFKGKLDLSKVLVETDNENKNFN
jgi:type I restriction enzyme S subunit